jgi:glycosyltransferase involved in cell wall biosynthesis
MAAQVLPVTVVIPTINRPEKLQRALQSILMQDHQPVKIVIIDASDNGETKQLIQSQYDERVIWEAAIVKGAAAQRNQAMQHVDSPYILYSDDDVIVKTDAVFRLWQVLENNQLVGGANAIMENQHFEYPGRIFGLFYQLVSGLKPDQLPGRIIGPGITFYPDDDASREDVQIVDWLYAGFTLYRTDLLPNPPFEKYFSGYSMGEDMFLSLKVKKGGQLANVQSARIFHDYHLSDDKLNLRKMARMSLRNRLFIMRYGLEKTSISDYVLLLLWDTLDAVAMIRIWPTQALSIFLGKMDVLFHSKTVSG